MSHITSFSGQHALPSRSEYVPAEPGWRKPNPNFKLTSSVTRGGEVSFPEFKGERVYMIPFMKTCGEVLLPSSLARWVPTVSQMLSGIESDDKMYLMIDQSSVAAGESHRRAGPHIDGNWCPSGGDFNPKELLVLASDAQGCVAYLGAYSPTNVGKGGDCSAIDLAKLSKMPLEANRAHICTVATIHESVPLKEAAQRTLVRINVPNGRRV